MFQNGLLRRRFTFSVLGLLLMFSAGCMSHKLHPPKGSKKRTVRIEATAYDNGKKSCGWKRNWYGRPVYAYGPNKGKPKKVGLTASGKQASMGTIAADTKYYPFGTVMYVPGYGYGVVEDRGGAIKGPNRIDLWYPSHKQALNWGRKTVKVTYWKDTKK